MKHTRTELGELEHQVMRLVWTHGPLTAETARELVDRGLKEATIRTVLRRLEEKGYLTHAVASRTFIYSAVESRERVAARAVKRIVDWFCEGSIDEVLVGMVDAEMLDSTHLDKLSKRIEQARSEAGSRDKTAKYPQKQPRCKRSK